MQDDRRTSTRLVDFESELSLDDFQEIVPFAFSENFKSGLSRQLREELSAFAAYRHDPTSGKLVSTHIAVEDLRIDFDFGMRNRRFCQRQTRIEEMESDVIDSSVVSRIGQDHDADPALQIKAHKG